MRTNRIQFSPLLNYWFYSVFGILFLSGVIWLLIRYSELAPWLLRIHGTAAMASLVILGVLIPAHMRRAWQRKRNQVTGIIMVALSLLMILSGYGLYYSGSDELRAWLSGSHSVAGCLLPLILVWHIIVGRKSRHKQREKTFYFNKYR